MTILHIVDPKIPLVEYGGIRISGPPEEIIRVLRSHGWNGNELSFECQIYKVETKESRLKEMENISRTIKTVSRIDSLYSEKVVSYAICNYKEPLNTTCKTCENRGNKLIDPSDMGKTKSVQCAVWGTAKIHYYEGFIE